MIFLSFFPWMMEEWVYARCIYKMLCIEIQLLVMTFRCTGMLFITLDAFMKNQPLKRIEIKECMYICGAATDNVLSS